MGTLVDATRKSQSVPSPQPIQWSKMKGTADDLMNDIRWVKLYGAMFRLHPTAEDGYGLDNPTDAMKDSAHCALIRDVWCRKIMDAFDTGLLKEHEDILDKFCQRKEDQNWKDVSAENSKSKKSGPVAASLTRRHSSVTPLQTAKPGMRSAQSEGGTMSCTGKGSDTDLEGR